MSCQVIVLAGPANSGKRAELLCAYRQALAELPLGSALWIAPTHRAVTEVSRQLLDGSLAGCFSPQLLTFDGLAARVLDAAAPGLRPLSRNMTRRILRELVGEAKNAGRLAYFAPISGTPGFLDLLMGFIRELKRLEIWPEELAAAQGRRAPARDRELCQLYQAYQDRLNQHRLFDAEGRFWAAREILRQGRWGPLSAVQQVYLEGFSDFTRTEHEVIEILAGRTRRMEIALTLEAEDRRRDLFAKTRLTLERLQGSHPDLQLQWLARPASAGALPHLEHGLFGNPRAAEKIQDSTGLEILAAASATHEIELLAERIKSLLTTGDASGRVTARDILVVFRSLRDVGPLVQEVFARYGVPVAVSTAPRLGDSPLIATLLKWLRLDLNDWPFRDVLAALGSNYFRPAWPELREGRGLAALDFLVRGLQLPEGRAQLERDVQWLEGRAAESSKPSRKLIAARAAAPLLRRIVQTLDDLPQEATLDAWWHALSHLAGELGLTAEIAAGEAPRTGDLDRRAWKRFELALQESQRLDRWTGLLPETLDRAELLELLEDLARTVEIPSSVDETGAVRVLAAESARGIRAPYVFLGGLNERSFPQASRDDCFYSDADARRWAEAGLPIPPNELRSRFEMLLFYEVVTSATKQLVLSYPALDSAAQPLVPSPYLTEIELACGRGHIQRNAEPHLASVPASDDVHCYRDFRVRAVANALAGDDALLSSLCAHAPTRRAAVNILAGLQTSESRLHQDTFGPFEGLFASPAVQSQLAEQFGQQRIWSPSQLERYAFCPHQFLLHNVLRLRPLEEPELGIDYLTRGEMLHWLLATAHRELNSAGGQPSSPAGQALEQFNAAVARLAAELRTKHAGGALESGLLEINVRKILEWLDRYSRQHTDYDRQWQGWELPLRPAHFEVAFGPPHYELDLEETYTLENDGDELSSLEPFELDCGDETIRFAGRIDRIDLGRIGGQQVFSIVDYKSGAVSTRTNLKAVKSGLSLQLPLYALAAEKLLSHKNAMPFRAAYWHLAGKGYQEKEAVRFRVEADSRVEIADEWLELETELRARVLSLVRGIRQGEFPMASADDKCTSLCQFSTVCRVNQARSLDKQWQPPQVSPT